MRAVEKWKLELRSLSHGNGQRCGTRVGAKHEGSATGQNWGVSLDTGIEIEFFGILDAGSDVA